jgi:putative SOS response-associated peptidase YedK
MCELYRITGHHETVRELTRTVVDHAGDLTDLSVVAPDQLAPVIWTAPDGVRELVMMRWGFPWMPMSVRRPITNIQNLSSSYWKPYVNKRAHRCLIPATSFCEPDIRLTPNVPTWFALDQLRPLFFFAGICCTWFGKRGPKADCEKREHQLFCILTTLPNATVAPFYPESMPMLLLTEKDRETWLSGTAEEALVLQRPAPENALRVVVSEHAYDS